MATFAATASGCPVRRRGRRRRMSPGCVAPPTAPRWCCATTMPPCIGGGRRSPSRRAPSSTRWSRPASRPSAARRLAGISLNLEALIEHSLPQQGLRHGRGPRRGAGGRCDQPAGARAPDRTEAAGDRGAAGRCLASGDPRALRRAPEAVGGVPRRPAGVRRCGGADDPRPRPDRGRRPLARQRERRRGRPAKTKAPRTKSTKTEGADGAVDSTLSSASPSDGQIGEMSPEHTSGDERTTDEMGCRAGRTVIAAEPASRRRTPAGLGATSRTPPATTRWFGAKRCASPTS